MRTFSVRPAMTALFLLGALIGRPANADEPPVGVSPPPAPSPVPFDPPEEIVAFPPAGLDLGVSAAHPDHAPDCPLFTRGRLTFEALAGAFFAPVGIGPTIPTFDYAPVSLRLGVIANTPDRGGCLRGSNEILIDLTVGTVFNGFGNVFGGPSLLLRRNFVQPDCRFVPYVQGGAGFVFTDAARDHTQRAIGGAFEFLLQAGVGCRYLVNDHLALNAEFDYQHISNANTSNRNYGVNALGGLVGVTYFFRKGQ